MIDSALRDFAVAYADHRAAEGRELTSMQLFSLPYLRDGPLAGQWSVRARSFDSFARHVLRPMARATGRRLKLLDLGAGNGWLSYRAALEGHFAIALDIREDSVDGLGAARAFIESLDRMKTVVASFDAIPLDDETVDLAVFNASLHYATDLAAAIAEAHRVTRKGGRLVILDSPFYRREAHGMAMVEEKRDRAASRFGEQAGILLALPHIEFLTTERLLAASGKFGLNWRRRRVFYPIAYELRPLRAWLQRQRPPSRFDLWVADRA